MNDRDLVLLSTSSCSPCEQALDLLFSMPELRGLPLRVLDVAEDDALLARYGRRLPVVRFSGRELDWPFTREQVVELLA